MDAKSEKGSEPEKISDASVSTTTSMGDENKKSKVYKFQENWKIDCLWLMLDSESNVVYCLVCR